MAAPPPMGPMGTFGPSSLHQEISSVTAVSRLSRQQLEILRELRAEVQDLQRALESVRKGEASLRTYSQYLARTVKDITALISEIQDRIPDVSDVIRSLHNSWEQMMTNPVLVNPETDFSVQEQLQYLDMLFVQIQRIVLLVGFLTIPTRVNDWLAQARPGYYIPFHLVFDDELPLQEDRTKLLSLLAWSPKAINGGIIDVANGLIYRYADERKERRNSFVLLILAFVVSTAVIVGACYVRVPGWPINSTHLYAFLVGWSALLIGIISHIGIASVKRAQAEGGLPPIIAVGDFFMIVNARAGQILLKLLMALIGFFGLVFGTGVNSVTPFNAFLLGYSLDSFIELFSSNIEQKASALKKQLELKG